MHHHMTWESMMIGPKCDVALQTDEHIAKLTVQETMDFSAWVQGTELREGASPLLPSTLLKQTALIAMMEGSSMIQKIACF